MALNPEVPHRADILEVPVPEAQNRVVHHPGLAEPGADIAKKNGETIALQPRLDRAGNPIVNH
jgi:hypothetical protein